VTTTVNAGALLAPGANQVVSWLQKIWHQSPGPYKSSFGTATQTHGTELNKDAGDY